MSYSISSILTPYDRTGAMSWLRRQFSWPGFDGPNFSDDTRANRRAIAEWLRRKCIAMRAAGIAGAHHYSLPLHTELLHILRAERAALQIGGRHRA